MQKKNRTWTKREQSLGFHLSVCHDTIRFHLRSAPRKNVGVPAICDCPACPHRAMWFGIGGNGVPAAPQAALRAWADARMHKTMMSRSSLRKAKSLGWAKYWELPLVVVNWLKSLPGGLSRPPKLGLSSPSKNSPRSCCPSRGDANDLAPFLKWPDQIRRPVQ